MTFAMERTKLVRLRKKLTLQLTVLARPRRTLAMERRGLARLRTSQVTQVTFCFLSC